MKQLQKIICANPERFHPDIPGTAYFDPEPEHLSRYYNSEPSKRIYFVALDENEQVVGGAGIAEFDGIESCADFRSSIWMIPSKGKAMEKNCCGRSKTGQGLSAIKIYTLKLTPICRLR